MAELGCPHEWRNRGPRKACMLCGAQVDLPPRPEPKPKKRGNPAWKSERRKMLDRINGRR